MLGSIGGYGVSWSTGPPAAASVTVGGTGLLFLPPLLIDRLSPEVPTMVVCWIQQLLRFANRIGVYLALMADHDPSSDEQQSVHLISPIPTDELV